MDAWNASFWRPASWTPTDQRAYLSSVMYTTNAPFQTIDVPYKATKLWRNVTFVQESFIPCWARAMEFPTFQKGIPINIMPAVFHSKFPLTSASSSLSSSCLEGVLYMSSYNKGGGKSAPNLVRLPTPCVTFGSTKERAKMFRLPHPILQSDPRI